MKKNQRKNLKSTWSLFYLRMKLLKVLLFIIMLYYLDEDDKHFYNLSMGNLIEEMNNTSP